MFFNKYNFRSRTTIDIVEVDIKQYILFFLIIFMN